MPVADIEYYEEDQDPTLLAKMHAASLVKEASAAAASRKADEMVPAPATAWGHATRLEAMKERLLALERDKIARMAPERLELMSLLADHGHTLDENTITTLLAWKKAR